MPFALLQVAILQFGQRGRDRELRPVSVLLPVTSLPRPHLNIVLKQLDMFLGNVEHRAALVFRHRVRLDRRHHVLGEVSPQRAPHVGDRSEGVQRAVEHRHEA